MDKPPLFLVPKLSKNANSCALDGLCLDKPPSRELHMDSYFTRSQSINGNKGALSAARLVDKDATRAGRRTMETQETKIEDQYELSLLGNVQKCAQPHCRRKISSYKAC